MRVQTGRLNIIYIFEMRFVPIAQINYICNLMITNYFELRSAEMKVVILVSL